jgi:hypothetical protein
MSDAGGQSEMPSVYLETTIPSYLAAYPSRDLIFAAHQQITHEWWRDAPQRFDLYISEAVLDEIRRGDPDAAARRLAFVDKLPVLELNDDVRALVHLYDQKLGLRGRARADLPHFAFAVAFETDYLVTWNCAHIANGEIVRRLREVNEELNRFTPLIVTPEEILETPGGRDS